MPGQQNRAGIGGFFALADHNGSAGSACKFVETQQWAGLGQPLPAPGRRSIGALAPGQPGEHLAPAAVIRAQVEAVQHRQHRALGVPVGPHLRRLTVLRVLERHLTHGPLRDRQHRHPLCRPGLARNGRVNGAARRDAEKVRQLVAGVQFAAAFQIVHQVDQVATLVAGGEVAPHARVDVHLERSRLLVGTGGIRRGVLLATIYPPASGQPMC
ncbi:hypothetical protein D3C78_634650 [compost metagenome]